MTDIHPIEYLMVLWRKRWLFLTIFGVIFLSSFVVALKWNKYTAYATIEVTPSEIAFNAMEFSNPQGVSVEAIADLQISRLKQKVLSTSSLADVITKLDLYSEKRKQTPIAYVAEDMRKSIGIRLVSTSLANPASAQKASAQQLSAIAFVLSFKYSNPQTAQQTLNELVSRFLDEDIKERRNTAEKTSDFLQGQIDVLATSLAEQEEKIAAFRAENGDIRPEALAFNQQASISTTTRYHAIESDIISHLGLIGALRSQLAQTDPYTRLAEDGEVLTSPSVQLRILKSQYATLTAKYGPQHPDVVKIKRQMRALQKTLAPESKKAGLKAKLISIKTELKTAKDTYGEDHPDVKALVQQEEKLQAQLKALGENDEENDLTIINDADNPAYLRIVAQLEATQKQIEALEQQKETIKKQQEEFKLAIAENPEAEKMLTVLSRDYENSIALYRDLKARKLAADISETIEQGRIGKRLSVIDAPELPRGTTPSRKIFVLAGFVFGGMAATGVVLALQLLNQTVIGPHHLESIVGMAPLVTIPHIKTMDDKIKIRKIGIKLLTALPFILLALAALFFLLVMPFDVFWALLTRRLGL